MHSVSSSDWAEGLYLTVTGLSKDERQHVREVVEAAGGRYSPNFSKRCTHLVVSADPSDASLLKVYLAGINKDKWHSRAVRFEWLLECANQHKVIAEAPFTVEAPAYEDLSLPNQRLQQIAVPTLSAADIGSALKGSDGSASVSKRGAVALEEMQNITTRSGSRQSNKRHKHLTTSAQHGSRIQEVDSTDVAAALAQSAARVPKQQSAHVSQLPQQSGQERPDVRTKNQAGYQLLRARTQQVAPLPLKQQVAPLPPDDLVMQDAQTFPSESGALLKAAAAGSAASNNCFKPVFGRANSDTANALPKSDSQTAHRQAVGVATGCSLASQLHQMHADAHLKAARYANTQGSARCNAPTMQTAACTKAQAPSAVPLASASAHVQLPGIGKTEAGRYAIVSAGATEAATTAPASNAPSKAAHQLRSAVQRKGAIATESLMRDDLAAETESLVAKLRALSQGRSDSASSKVKRPSSSQAPSVSTKRQLGETAKPLLPAGPDIKRTKQCDTASISGNATSLSAMSGPTQQQRANASRRIQVTDPVHSSSHLRTSHSSVSQGQQLKGTRSNPSQTSLNRHASVGAPIQLQPQQASSSAPATAVATDPAKSQAPAAVNMPQEQSSAPQARLGKATPLKKVFTPRPSRFRLEAERRSVTPPDKGNGASKVLFGSPETIQESVSAVGTAKIAQTEQMQTSDTVNAAICAIPAPTEADTAQHMDTEMPLTLFRTTADACASATVHNASAPAQVALTPANQICASKGVFFGMKVILDPELPHEESVRMGKAVQAGGGEVAGSAHLGSGATHVVCQPEAAVKWLAMGLSIVSPPWLLRSLAQGTPDRCLQMSLDASRHLPPSALSKSAAHSNSKSSSAQHSSAMPEFADREVRQALVQQLQTQGPHVHWGAAQQALQTPQFMLEEVLWSLSEPPEQARLDSMLATSAAPSNHQFSADDDTAMADCSSMLSASQEACQAELAMVEAECSSNADYAPVISVSSSSQPGHAFQTADWQEVIYQAPALTLLLPMDSTGACGYCTRSLQIPSRGCSRQLLMHSIYSFYQEELDVREQLKMMQISSSAASAVKEVFLEGVAVKRIALMHTKVNLDGLERVSRNLTGTIYEVKLSC